MTSNSHIQQTERGLLIVDLSRILHKHFQAQKKASIGAFAETQGDLADYIESHTAQAVLSARLEERKAVALDNYRGQTFSESTNYRGKFDKFIRNNERRIAELEATTLNLKGDK